MVVEADEFDRSFLSLFPILAVITTIDRDHLDTYQRPRRDPRRLRRLREPGPVLRPGDRLRRRSERRRAAAATRRPPRDDLRPRRGRDLLRGRGLEMSPGRDVASRSATAAQGELGAAHAAARRAAQRAQRARARSASALALGIPMPVDRRAPSPASPACTAASSASAQFAGRRGGRRLRPPSRPRWRRRSPRRGRSSRAACCTPSSSRTSISRTRDLAEEFGRALLGGRPRGRHRRLPVARAADRRASPASSWRARRARSGIRGSTTVPTGAALPALLAGVDDGDVVLTLGAGDIYRLAEALVKGEAA